MVFQYNMSWNGIYAAPAPSKEPYWYINDSDIMKLTMNGEKGLKHEIKQSGAIPRGGKLDQLDL